MSEHQRPSQPSKSQEGLNRRQFVASAGAAALSFTIASPNVARTYAANSKVRLGLLGCGGRGTWIAKLFRDHGGYDVVAAADYFQDRTDNLGNQLNVPASQRYTGLKGYLKLLDKVDAVAIERIKRIKEGGRDAF